MVNAVEYIIENALEKAENYKYTFSIPSRQQILNLEKGDVVKLMFTENQDTERMWLSIEEIRKGENDQSPINFTGKLDNQPYNIKSISLGSRIDFKDYHIIAIYDKPNEFVHPSLAHLPARIMAMTGKLCYVSKEYFNNEDKTLGYIYRENPVSSSDSGWRFTSGDEPDGYMQIKRNTQPVRITAILNRDDSFVGLLNSPINSHFVFDSEEKQWLELEDA
ncbi:hypothetical protein DICPUDRAFT_99877 [Dictyostelium purpureum]|uniref:Immunity protein Imm33 domain-containing protein n=1 Tax=Dictyostelium purpureum TaxID=5786 RepID=F1A3C9_DICPU|nr:uncharacterized protein DICPUDRAFT_99877 [Dictyostelium purpureum]EGC29302.1 hypothetical protein DICPUDRAFT_99877 [Dictyostelium purpureum]|eukprot:XP_003294170.1 hypothetical protein DICPUDRAFT_99877 [Dictyostelium purpureum]